LRLGAHSNPIEMENDLTSLNLQELSELYEKANEELRQSLINGQSWKEVKAKRDVVTDIAKELHRKKETYSKQ
jgi:hypothetical protein